MEFTQTSDQKRIIRKKEKRIKELMHNPVRKLLKLVLRYGERQGINIKEALSIEEAHQQIGQAIEAKVKAETT